MREGEQILANHEAVYAKAVFTKERIAQLKPLGHALDPETPIRALYPVSIGNERDIQDEVNVFMRRDSVASQALREWHETVDALPPSFRAQLTAALRGVFRNFKESFGDELTLKLIREADLDELITKYAVNEVRAAALKEIFGYFDEFPPTI